MADSDLLESCATLFSAHYGTWGQTGPRPGEPIRITTEHVAKLLGCDGAHIVCAYDGPTLAGYAVILRFDSSDGRRVAWIAQLVVHATYRQSRVATMLMFSAWQFSDFDVWGVITANPYAIRALETATRRPCRAKSILEEHGTILDDLRNCLDYLPAGLDTTDGQMRPSIDTRFPVDLKDMDIMKQGAARADRPWNLGSIEEGHEWFAVTFSSQAPTVARGEYLDDLLSGADSIWIRAYEGMTLDTQHAWHRHGSDEVAWVIDRLQLPPGSRVLDAGCGDGRHAVALAERGFDVSAIDISPRLVERAQQRFELANVSVGIRAGDLRHDNDIPEGPFDAIVCLYDVVGSSADPADDQLILRSLRARLKEGGSLVLSVMSSVGTLEALPVEQRPKSEEEFVTVLEQLTPSRNMERSGSVFDPRHIVHYEGRFYRKEQFDLANDLPPGELIIRDRRFDATEIAQAVQTAGFGVVEMVGARAGAWQAPLEPNDPDARELLLIAVAQ